MTWLQQFFLNQRKVEKKMLGVLKAWFLGVFINRGEGKESKRRATSYPGSRVLMLLLPAPFQCFALLSESPTPQESLSTQPANGEATRIQGVSKCL